MYMQTILVSFFFKPHRVKGVCVYTKSFTHTHHNSKSGYLWVNGLWVAASLSFSLFSRVSIKNIITFIIRSKDKVHALTHTHKTLIRTLSPSEAGCCLKEPVTGLIFGGRCTAGRQAEQQEIQITMSALNSFRNVLGWFQMFSKSKLHLGILLGHQKGTKEMEYQSYQVSICPNYFIFHFIT